MSINERLREFLTQGKDWERKPTNISGVFLLRLPGLRSTNPSVAIEINPVDSIGSPTKKRGVVIRSTQELEEIKRLLLDQKVIELTRNMDEVNPQRKQTATTTSKPDVFEI
jgi:hypothetical protein